MDGVDIAKDAVAFAKENWKRDNLSFAQADACQGPLPPAETATCFKVLEHVAEPERVLKFISSNYKTLLMSFPNPLAGGSHLKPHHLVDWPLHKLCRELSKCGARDIKKYHQGMRGQNITSGAHLCNAYWILKVDF